MKYRNRKTGNVIDVPSFVEGDDWELIPEEKPGGAKTPESGAARDEDGGKRPGKTAKRTNARKDDEK